MNQPSPSKGISHTHTHTEFQLLEKKTFMLAVLRRTSYTLFIHFLLNYLVSYQPDLKALNDKV